MKRQRDDIMSAKKNKSKNAPAVGKPAAGSNNKREKKELNKKAEQKNVADKRDKKKISAATSKKTNAVSKAKPQRKSLKESFKSFKEKYNIGKIALAIAAVLLVVAGAAVLVVSLFSHGVKVSDSVKNAEFKGRLEPDTVAYATDISSSQQKKLAKAVKSKGSHRFDFFVNEEVVLSEPTDSALLEFGSVSSNDCILIAFLLDESGKTLYRSLGVEPGEEIKSVRLFEEMPYGTHKLTLVVNGYNAESYEKIGTKTAEIQIKIGVD